MGSRAARSPRAWFAIALGTLACSGADTAAPTDATEATDHTDAPVVCDYADIAGDWEGGVVSEGVTLDVRASLVPLAQEGQRVGGYTVDLGNDPSRHCESDLLCLGKTQNDWRVVMDKTTEGANCSDAWVFLRLEQNGTLTFEVGLSEFGSHVASGSLTRVD